MCVSKKITYKCTRVYNKRHREEKVPGLTEIQLQQAGAKCT